MAKHETAPVAATEIEVAPVTPIVETSIEGPAAMPAVAPAAKVAKAPRKPTVSLTLTDELAAILDKLAVEQHTVRAGVSLKLLAGAVNYELPAQTVIVSTRTPKMSKEDRKTFDAGRSARTKAIMAAIERGETVDPTNFALDKYIAAAKADAAKVASKPATAAA